MVTITTALLIEGSREEVASKLNELTAGEWEVIDELTEVVPGRFNAIVALPEPIHGPEYSEE